MSKFENLLKHFMFYSILVFAPAVLADQLRINYLDDDGNEQILTIDASSSDVDNLLAATLILEGVKMTVILDEKEDLEVIAEAVLAHSPDKATAIAVRNSILGVGVSLGGRSIERTPQALETDILQVDTPPLSPYSPSPLPSPPPPPSSPPPDGPKASPN